MDSERIASRIKDLIDSDNSTKALDAAWSLANDLGTELSANRLHILREFQEAVAVALHQLEKPPTEPPTPGEVQAIQRTALRTTLHVCEAYDVGITPVVWRKADLRLEWMKKTRLTILRRLAQSHQEHRPSELAESLQLHRSAVSRALRELHEDGLICRAGPSGPIVDGRNRSYKVTDRGRQVLNHVSGSDHGTDSGSQPEEDPDGVGTLLDQLFGHISITGQTGLMVNGFPGWGEPVSRHLRHSPPGWGRRSIHPIYRAITRYAEWERVRAEIEQEVEAIRPDRQAFPLVVLDDLRFADIMRFSQTRPGDEDDDFDMVLRLDIDKLQRRMHSFLNQELIGRRIPVIYFQGDADFTFPKEDYDKPKWKELSRTAPGGVSLRSPSFATVPEYRIEIEGVREPVRRRTLPAGVRHKRRRVPVPA